MKIKKGLVFFSIVLLLSLMGACKSTKALSSKVSLGMTKEQVIKQYGNPYKQLAKYDLMKNTKEVLFYKEKVWEGGDHRLTINHILIFKNGKLIEIKQGPEEHQYPQDIYFD